MQPSNSSLALVTGAAHRLGKAFAISLAKLGYSIALHYRGSADEAEKTVKEIRALNVDCIPIRADLTKPKKIDFLFSLVDEFKQPLKVVVNSAAVMPVGKADELELKDWNSAIDLNLRAPFLISQQAAKRMTNGGLIVNIADIDIAVRKLTAKRDGEKQIVVINTPVIISVGVRKILHEFDSALPENSQKQTRINALIFAAEFQAVISGD